MRSNHISLAFIIRDLDVGKGGAERVFVETANMFSSLGYKTSCVYSGADIDRVQLALDHDVRLINLAAGKTKKVTRIIRLPRLRRRIRYLFQKLSALKPFQRPLWELQHRTFQKGLEKYFDQEEPDVAISFLPSANTPTLLAAQSFSIRTVCTNHNRPEADYDNPGRWDPNPLDRFLRLDCLKNADAIHVLFSEFAEWFPCELQGKIHVIPNHVPLDIVSHSPVVKKEKVVIAVGRLVTVKQFNVLLKSWSKITENHQDWKLEIYGDGPEGGRLKALAQDLDILDSVTFHPFTREIASVYARSSILCHPALFEGFGLVVAEALALQVPVIAFSDCTGVNQLVAHEKNGVLVTRDNAVVTLAEGLEKLMIDEGLRTRLGHNGPKSIESYNFEVYRQRWLDLIESIAV